VLDHGAVLLTEFQAVVGEPKVVGPGRLHLPDGWDRTTAEVGAFRGRLRLWFDDDDDVVKSFDDVLGHAVWASELREGIDDAAARPANISPEQFEAMRPHFAEYIGKDVDVYRKQFLDAARKHLRTTASFGDC
jgi:hypothetical protein